MAKRKSFSKTHSIKRLPKGLPTRSNGGSANPFEISQRMKRPKFAVHNRSTTLSSNAPRVDTQRQSALAAALQQQRKANVFSDQRIGERGDVSNDAKNLARLVRERARQSKRISQYALEEDEPVLLTHKGQAIRDMSEVDHVLLSDDDDEDGDLDAYDTEMHFGGGREDAQFNATYGSSVGNLSTAYEQRKQDLDDRIMRRKAMKLDRLKAKEEQVDHFEAMDQSFQELSGLLQFRDKEQEIRQRAQARRTGAVLPEDQEYDDWDREMKQYIYGERKVAATDRTKTPEEIAKEEAERLQQLETRRLARMNGEVDDDEDQRVPRKKGRTVTADALDDEDDNVEDASTHRTTRFTSEGLVYVDREGVILGKVSEMDHLDEKNTDELDEDITNSLPVREYQVGDKVSANYRAKEQYAGQESWYAGVIVKVVDDSSGERTYNIEYDDGDFEEGVEPQYIRSAEEESIEKTSSEHSKDREVALRRQRQKAIDEARMEIPYVFEVPTTLESFHTLISKYATTGSDVSLIIQRIHKSNSVRLDRRNSEKMQNFYDVLLRRFVAVGDSIYSSGNGGKELDRYKQLDSLTQTLYSMAQEMPDTAGAVWNRRLGILQSAHSKRLRDAGGEHVASTADNDTEEISAWPSTGVILLLRALGHIFPVTDLRHHVVTPTILFLGQILGHTPILSLHDLVMGTICCGLLIEYTKEAKRIVPEAHAFLASVLRFFAHDDVDRQESYPLPTFHAASKLEAFSSLRSIVPNIDKDWDDASPPQLSLELSMMRSHSMPAAILYAALHWIEVSIQNLSGSLGRAEWETFAEIARALYVLLPAKKAVNAWPSVVSAKITTVVALVRSLDEAAHSRPPLQRRAMTGKPALVTLAPRLEDPDRYTMTKDRRKSSSAELERTRREYKREHKAVARELRLDNAMIETERRRVQDEKDAVAKAKRQRAFAWLESEQGIMNQQVRQGGGLLQGGGTAAAKAKAASGKVGIKKGGKLR